MTKTFKLPKYSWKLLIVALIVATGISLHFFGLLEPRKILDLARGYSDHWLLVVGLILLQIILYTFALTGSVALWIVAPIYSPVVATLILAAGGTLGGISAYYFSRQLTNDWETRIEKSYIYKLIHKQNNCH